MNPDENELRKALESRSGEVTPEYRARVRQAMADAPAPRDWMAMVAVLVVTALTATSVGVLVVARHARVSGPVASGPRVTSPTPLPTPSPVAQGANVQLSAPSTGVVWALVGYGTLYRSTDSGDHWEQRPLPGNVGVRPSIAFVNENEGWLLAPGSPATQCQEQLADLWRTGDGGATWVDVGQNIDKTQCKDGVWFVDSNHGFVSAWDQNHRPTVYFSWDRGNDWKPATLSDPPDFKTLPGGFTLRVEWIKQVGTTLYLEAYGEQGAGTPYPDIPDRQYLFTSTDFGATWVWKQKVPSRVLAVVTASRLVEMDAPGQLAESTNGGQAIGPFTSDVIGVPMEGAALVFADANVGYLVGGGTLQRTVNGGSHWVQLAAPGSPGSPASSPSPTPSAIPMPTEAQLSAPSTYVVWALVGGSRLFLSTNLGKSWTERLWPAYGGGGGYPEISFADDLHGYALFPGVPGTQCLQSGAQLWQTTDGAKSWRVVTNVSDQSAGPHALTFDQCKDLVYFTSATDGLVAGHDTIRRPIISRTSDSGATWSQTTLPDPPGYVTNGGGNALQVVSIQAFGGTILAVAIAPGVGTEAKFIFESHDGGSSWAFVRQMAGNPDQPLALVTTTRWLVIGNDGNGQETLDAGKTWHAFTCNYNDAAGVASTFVFADANVGYGTVRGGIQLTGDGGKLWVRLHTPGT